MKFRHEVKHEISSHDMLVLRQRLQAVMKPDRHAVDGKYEIRSLYFDNLDDDALREKLDGVSIREKYRIRLYNNNQSVIRLERKYSVADLALKPRSESCANKLKHWRGNISRMASSTDEVILGFYARARNGGLQAKVIVEYTREPFVFPPATQE